MKVTTAVGGTLLAFEIGAIVLNVVARRHAKKRSKTLAVEARTPEQAAAFEEATKRCDIFKAMSEREKKEQDSMVKAWKMSKEYEARKSQILKATDDGLNEFKTQLGYFDKIDEFDEEFEAGLEAFKKTIDYDSTKQKLEEAIKEAEKHYENQKAAFDVAGDDISETTMKLRHAAEEAKVTKVKECKEKIAALDKQVEEETDKLRKVKLDKTKTLEEKVAKEEIRLGKKQDHDLDKLNRELDNAKLDIQKQIQKERSSDEIAAVTAHEDDIRLINEQKKIDAEVADDIFKSSPGEEDVAEYLKSKKVPRWVVGVVAAIPFACVEYLCYTYVKYVVGVIRRMA